MTQTTSGETNQQENKPTGEQTGGETGKSSADANWLARLFTRKTRHLCLYCSKHYSWLAPLFTRKMLICVFTGFSSGMPLFLLLQLIPAWMAKGGVDIKTIGFSALAQLPFILKFLWAPMLDRYALPLGRRRGWMLTAQIALLFLIGLLGSFTPAEDIDVILCLAMLLAFYAATQDIAIDAYRREILFGDTELGLGNSVHVNAYRVAGLVPGSLSLILADNLSWSAVFWITALFMLPGIGMTLLVKEPEVKSLPRTLTEACVLPFFDFIRRQGWRSALLVLSFIFLYKLGDSLATALATPFYLKMGFSMTDIGLIAKHAGLWPAVFGGLAGTLIMARIGINRSLWLFGVVQFVTILGFVWLAWIGPFEAGAITLNNRLSLAAVVSAEYLGAGLGTAAFIAFIARATNPVYTATQFALFTSLAAMPRTVVNAFAGVFVDALGWTRFFLLCALLAIPGMLMLFKVAPWNGAGMGKESAEEKEGIETNEANGD